MASLQALWQERCIFKYIRNGKSTTLIFYKNTSLEVGGKLRKIKNKAEPEALSQNVFLENDAEAFH